MLRIIYAAGAYLVFSLPVLLSAQTPSQTIRGQVTDAASGSSIPGVTVMELDQDPVTGTTTDSGGNFRLTSVPVGRHTLRFSYVGYEVRFVQDLMVTSGRETVLSITLQESVTEMDEIVVRPGQTKTRPINSMALSSSRQLSMEEASRYAGGYDDPARLASSFAGVTGNLADNAIVIRGNAPKGMLWQMEGVEIPAPSHFANIITMGGGGVTALSSHMIADSDFYTGAFPAEYGNALSGVFDLNLRNGNNQQHEHALRVGTVGLDLASEGPVAGAASYLFNYRYSTFSLISSLLPEDAGGIYYQNLSYKVNLPTSGAGTFSIWGIGATDWSGTSAAESPGDWTYDQDREESESPTRFGAAGLRHRVLLGGDAFLATTLASSGSGLRWELARYTDDATILAPLEYIHSESGKLTVKSVLNVRTGSRHSNRTGLAVNRLGFHQHIRHSGETDSPLETIVDETGSSYLYQAFSQSRFDPGPFILTGGLHLLHFTLTGASSLEPRLGTELRTGQNSYSITYGRHSQTEPLSIYLSHRDNRNLDLATADHFVAGFSRMVHPDVLLKLEAYYQWLSDVPVIPDSSFSVINLELDWFVRSRFTNDGAGRNYGLELTLERYLSRGWYGLLTGSLFDSRYRGGDGRWRDTRFNRGYSFVLLGGKEWDFRGDDKVRFLSLNGRINFLGGKRRSPVDMQLTQERREVFYDETRAFSRSEPNVIYADATVELRTNHTTTASVWSLQLLNITGYEEFYGYRYNLREDTVDEEREMILIPNVSYRIEF